MCARCSCQDGWIPDPDGDRPCPLCNGGDPPRRPASFTTHLPTERGSVRTVTIEGDHVSYVCEVRTIRGQGLRPGDYCWVEFGAYWTERAGLKTRHAGQWRLCLVLPSPSATAEGVHVRLDSFAGLRLVPPG